jgi:hypothetical protein
MPGLNGTGPLGTGPMRGRYPVRCRMIVAPALAVPVQQATEGSEAAVPQDSLQNTPVYGRGRGGIPCGCGHGFGFGGGRRLRG